MPHSKVAFCLGPWYHKHLKIILKLKEDCFVKKTLICLLSVLMLAGCGPAVSVEERDADRLQIVATVFPAYDFARAVAGDTADVTMLLPPGMESHSYEPTPADILAVQNCDLFIYLGGESDAWVDTILTAIEPKGEALRMVDCVELLEEEHVEGMQEQPGHDHDHEGHDHGADEECEEQDTHTEPDDHDAHEEHSDHEEAEEHTELHEDMGLGQVVGMDEHVWTSPRNAADITLEIGEKLAELDEEKATLYRENAAVYAGKIDQLDHKFEAFFAGCPDPVIVFGDRFPLRYFAERYELDYYAAFPGCGTQTEPSAATIAFLTDKVRSEGIPTVWYIEFSNHLVADCIAETTGTQTAMFHTCHNVTKAEMDTGATYLSLMEENLVTLQQYFA